MSNDVKAIILCNNPIALPGIREFLFYKKVGAFVVTKRNKEMQGIIASINEGYEVPVIIVDRKNYVAEIIDAIGKYEINTGLVMTFPFILPDSIWQLPARGFINFHYGLLPQCRGPHPILWHLLNNDKEAGITLHKMDDGIDTGEIILQEKTAIEQQDTYGTLQGKLAFLAAKAAANLLKILSFGSIIPSRKQEESLAVYYEKPTAAELTIRWAEMPAEKIIRVINACNPWNKGAGTTINNWFLGITEAEIAGEAESDDKLPGTVLSCAAADGLIVKTADNKKLKINIIYTNEGFFSGHRLAQFGIKTDMQFV
jgi:methionyl-tRNA formyltransferase